MKPQHTRTNHPSQDPSIETSIDLLSATVLDAILAYDASDDHSPLPFSGEHSEANDCVRCAMARRLFPSHREAARKSCVAAYNRRVRRAG